MSAPSLLMLPGTGVPVCCEDETWKSLPGWPHEASTCGRVRSLTRLDMDGRLRLGGILAQCPDKRKGKGYLYVNLRDGKRHRRVHVAVVVLEAHRSLRPGKGWEASHLYGVRTDNHLPGLAWETREQNLARIRQHALARAAETVTPQSAETPSRYRSQVRGGDACRRPRRYGVTVARRGNAAKGTGRFPSFLTFRPVFLSLKPRFRTVRNLPSRSAP